MAFGSEQWMYSAGGFYPDEIGQSLRFDDAYLSRTPSVAGNRKTWTWSGWVKLGSSNASRYLLGAYSGSSTDGGVFVSNSAAFGLSISGNTYNKYTSAVLRDSSSWYHLVVVFDTDNTVAANRIRLYINGDEQTDYYTQNSGLPPQGYTPSFFNNAGFGHEIGKLAGYTAGYLDGYLAEVNFVDGQALDPTDFGETKSGVWIPKEYEGTYGTNGYYLKFEGIEGINDLVTNGDFVAATDLSDWTLSGSTTPALQSDGLKLTVGAADGRVVQYVTTEVGKSYTVEMNVVTQSGGGTRMEIDDSLVFDTANEGEGAAAQGVWRATFTATTTSTKFELYQAYGGFCVLGWAKMYNNVTVDSSGNDNDWQTHNIYDTDVMLDSPTNNFATLNPLFSTPSGAEVATFSQGNLSASLNDYGVASSSATQSGKWYYETIITSKAGTIYIGIGDDNVESGKGSGFSWSDAYMYLSTGVAGGNGVTGSYGATYGVGDVIGVAYDLEAGSITFYKNGVSQGVAFNTGFSSEKTYKPWIYCQASNTIALNFGQDSSFAGNKTRQGNTDANGIGDFYYAPPEDYLALCSANLPDTAIDPAKDDIPADYFNPVLYTGNGSTQSITGVGFQPDWVWIKERSSTSGHILTDVVRGVTNYLSSNTTAAEFGGDRVRSFDADGFEVGIDGATNENSQTYVAWNWKAGGTAVANTDGTIASQVSANTKAGFSVVTYTGQTTADTVGHGLEQPLDFIIVKNRDTTNQWAVYSRALGSDVFMYLNSTQAAVSGNTSVWNNTDPTSSVFSIGTSNSTSGASSGDELVAYCFHSVEGFSKMGSYTGNGSTDGPFVYTGFRPAYVMVKNASLGTRSWYVFDNKINPNNVSGASLNPDLSNAEGSVDPEGYDFLSNGFKVRDAANAFNQSGGTFIFMAFAEMPFKYANAR
jgi:hypothetical protein